MTEADARRAWLLRAYEDPPQPPWSAADAAWASDEANRRLGEAIDAESFVAGRAALGLERLASRDDATSRLLSLATWPHWALASIVAAAFALGVAADAIGPSQRINLLAPPLLGLVAWNLLVYAALALQAVSRPRSSEPGPVRRAVASVWQRITRRHDQSAAARRFAEDWFSTSRDLQTRRLALLLHAGAAALAIGVIASIYLRGLAFEYRAGWESTFLDASQVHALLSAVLAPASALSGLQVPDAGTLAGLRFPASAGGNAASWIHLEALSLALFVVLPRLVLAGWANSQARRQASAFSLPMRDAYFQRLAIQPASTTGSKRLAVRVTPYSYHPSTAACEGLERWLEAEFGARLHMQIAEPVSLGSEGEASLDEDAMPSADLFVALFAMTATPERETHGAFLRSWLRRTAGSDARVLIDASGFNQRFGRGSLQRADDRRSAWQRLLADAGASATFADLAPDAATLGEKEASP